MLTLLNINRIAEAVCLWGVSQKFTFLESQRHLTQEQCLKLKSDGRPCPKVTLKYRTSESVYETFPWMCGDEVKNTHFCWQCLVMGDLSTVSK